MKTKNNSIIDLNQIEEISYNEFSNFLRQTKNKNFRCINYFATEQEDKIKLWAIIGRDDSEDIELKSCTLKKGSKIQSLSTEIPAINIFEREIEEVYDIEFLSNPWKKPLRFPYNRKDKNSSIDKYPFFTINSDVLHEVGVGPIHAGIIEPGHFRFICNGEKILHLEIQLGYQHRGIEKLIVENKSLVFKTKLAEVISGDSVVAHTLAFSNIIETLAGIKIDENLEIERTIALELERIAMHTFGLSALCTDIAYQFGAVALQDLRTIIINTFLSWCGNRFAHKLIQPGYSKYTIDNETKLTIEKNLKEFQKRFAEVTSIMLDLPSVLNRFEGVGTVTKEQAYDMQFVGMVARSCGIKRDVRESNPFAFYKNEKIEPVVLSKGDVKSRVKIRQLETLKSVDYIFKIMNYHQLKNFNSPEIKRLKSNAIAISLTESWRGEVNHIAITDANGEIVYYKIKDPSLHNWMALALAVRNNDISDFPICNKSFDLSYCGFDL